MEARPAHVRRTGLEAQDQYPTSRRSRNGKLIGPGDDKTLLLLLLIALFLPPISVFYITGCDGHFALNVILELLTLGIASFFHALFVIFHYGKGGRLTGRQRQKLDQQKRTAALEFPVNAQPPQVRSEAYADAPDYSASGGGYGGDSKYS